MTDTVLDRAHAAMTAAPDDDALRLAFYERLADGELFLLLETEARGDTVTPRVFSTDDGRYTLAFDREDRLTDFASGPAPYAALSGRRLAGLLTLEGLGLGLNFGAPSETLITVEAIAWLAGTLAERPVEIEDVPMSLSPPAGLPEELVTAIDTKLATAAGLAKLAYLAGVGWKDGKQGHLLAFIDSLEGSEDALARAVAEALIFSGVDAGELDVTFLVASDPAAARLAKVGLRFDLPEANKGAAPKAPGMDPDRPPKLR